MAEHHHIHLGTEVGYLQRTRPFGIFHDDIFQHIWVNGQTGVGKSTILKVMYANIVAQGFGCTLVDFNGDLADEALDITPISRVDDVVFCDLADLEYAIPTNPLYGVPRIEHATFAEQFANTLKHIYKESWGNRMDHLLKNTIRALLDAPADLQPTIYSIAHVLSNKHYRKKVFEAATDPELRKYYKTELTPKPDRELREHSEAIFNKVGNLTSNPYLLNTMASYKPTFQSRNVIKDRSILILRLPKGLIGDGSKLYGSMAVSSIINEAYSQQALPEADRIPHYLLIDETLNLEHGCLVEPVAETRKYKLGIVASSQYTKQLDPELYDALLGNAGNFIAYRSSVDDAKLFAEQMGEFHQRQFTSLKRGEAIVRSLKDGSPYGPFRAFIDPADVPIHAQSEQIRGVSRAHYGVPTKQIFDTFSRWVNKETIEPETRKQHQQDVSQKQRTTTIAKLERHLAKSDTKPLTRRQQEQRIKDIADMLDNRGRSDPRWPKDVKLFKTRRPRARKRRPKSAADKPPHV